MANNNPAGWRFLSAGPITPQIMIYKLYNEEMGYLCTQIYEDPREAAREAATKCRNHQVIEINENGEERPLSFREQIALLREASK